MTKTFIRNTRRLIAFFLVIIMTFENPAATLAADTGTILSVNDDRLIEENDPVMTESDDAEEAILEESLEEDIADDVLSDAAQDIILEEYFSEDVLSDNTVSDDSVSDNLIEEVSDDGYFEDDIVEEYEILPISSNELLHELPQKVVRKLQFPVLQTSFEQFLTFGSLLEFSLVKNLPYLAAGL